MYPLEKTIDKGKIMLLDIDVKGGCSIMDEFNGNTISIFIEPPGEDINEQIETLEKRLKNRGHESDTLIKQRTKRMQLELEYKDKFGHHFVNENLKETTDEIEKLIRRKSK
jgi:guanylate kinase